MYEVVLTERADRDIVSILEYVERESPAAAEQLAEHFAVAFASLRHFPLRCVRAPESDAWGCDVHSMLVFNYRALFSVKEHRVRILRVVHGSMERPVDLWR